MWDLAKTKEIAATLTREEWKTADWIRTQYRELHNDTVIGRFTAKQWRALLDYRASMSES